jgi:hypothetical protein
MLLAPLGGCGWCPEPGDQRQDVGEHLSRHRHLCLWERDVTIVANDLRADLDQLLAQADQRPGQVSPDFGGQPSTSISFRENGLTG